MTRLYTLQADTFDITAQAPHEAPYSTPGEPYYDLARHLQRHTWLWCLPALADFDNEWFYLTPERLAKLTLWTLEVPADAITWCGMDAQCENQTPPAAWLYSSEEACRAAGDIPQALITATVLTPWVITRQPATVLQGQ